MHEAMERASHEKYTEQEMLVTVIEYIAGHKFFAHDPRNGKVHNQLEILNQGYIFASVRRASAVRWYANA